MIKTEFFDKDYHLVDADSASIIEISEIDSEGNIKDKKTLHFERNQAKTKFFSRSFEENHWETINAMQRLIDLYWKFYHSANDESRKIEIMDKLLFCYDRMDMVMERIESRASRRKGLFD